MSAAGTTIDGTGGRGGAVSTLLAGASSTPVLAFVIALITWRPLQVRPESGFDPSWVTGLVMASHQGLDFGTQVIFTYGPLGFLRFPLVMYGGLSVLSTLYVVAVRVGFAATVLWAARRGLPLPIAIIVALAASWIARPDAIVVIVFLGCAAAIAEDPPKWAAPVVIYGGAVVSAVESLVKLNSGGLVLALCLITVLLVEGSRLANVLRFLATFVATFAILWFASGQGVGNLYEYFRTAFDVISGYTGAMSLSTGRRWVLVPAAVLCCVAVGAWMLAARRLPRARAAGLVSLVVIFSFFSWKEGFVREDSGHVAFFFSWMVAPWIALTWVRGWGRLAGLVGVAVVVLLYYGGTGFYPWLEGSTKVDPIASTKAAVNDVYDLVDPAERGRERDDARTTLAAQYGLDPKIRRMIGDQPVAIQPTEISLAWAYRLNWYPLPAFQSATAYTPLLDHRNAEALTSADGPAVVLRQMGGGIDGRYVNYDTPATTLAMLCDFRVLHTTPQYQLLGRAPDRCGEPRVFASVGADYGQTLQVPRPPHGGEAVFARVSGVNPIGLEKLRSLLYKPTSRWVVIDGKWTYRLVAANAADGLLLSTPPSGDFSAPQFESATWSWKLAPRPNASAISFQKNASVASPGNRLRIDFYAMPVHGSR
jgi:hypothetical protein